MANSFSKPLDPARLASNNAELAGTVPLMQFARLQDELNNDTGELNLNLRFKQIATGHKCIEGELHTAYPLLCQRCLAPMLYPVDTQFNLVIIEDEAELDELPDTYDPVLGEGRILFTLADLLEDELLLLLPAAPSHVNENDCDPNLVYKAAPDSGGADATEKRSNPFAVLKDLTKKT